MTIQLLYDGRMSGADIVTAIGTVSGANLLSVPYANGQRVIVIETA